MSRKDYQNMAETIRQSLDARLEGKSSGWIIEQIVDGMVQMFAANNPRFDRQRFYSACGLDENGWLIRNQPHRH